MGSKLWIRGGGRPLML